jgi:asparaginyl-tRNA synthetase
MPSEKVPSLVTGSSIEVSGCIVQGPKALELQGDSIITLGTSDMVKSIKEYPLAKKAHSFEHLRDCVHFRPRTETIAASLRLRSESSFAIHDYFRRQGTIKAGFYYIHTPVITGNDCEGAGEMFEIKDSEDFFGKKAFLTVSGQLHGEIFASSLGRIYTFGPTFRAEKSHTQRHLAEFWMVEPEMVHFSLEETFGLAEDLIKETVSHVLKNNSNDLVILERKKEVLEEIIGKKWEVIKYDDAKRLTGKNEVGLSTEEERWLVVGNK